MNFPGLSCLLSARSLDSLVALILFASALGLYVTTLTPGLAHAAGDGHELTIVAATLGLAHPTGYPLFTWLGFAFTQLPIGSIAYRTNLMSAVLGAGGIALLYLVARRLGLHRLAAGLSAALFAVSTTFWSQAVKTEVYAPNAFMVALGLWLLLGWAALAESPATRPRADRLFPVFALVYGLSLGTHLSHLGFAPAYAVFVLWTDPRIVTRRATPVALVVFAVGAAQFLWLPLRAHAGDLFPNTPPDTPARFYDYTLGAFRVLRFAYPLAELPARLSVYASLLANNFGPAGVTLGLIGMWILARRSARRFCLLAGMYAVHVAFFTQFLTPDIESFFVASHLLFALFIGWGAQALHDAIGRIVARASPAGRGAALLPAAAVLLALGVPSVRLAIASFRANDGRFDTAVDDFQQSSFAVLPEASMLVCRRGAFGAAVFYWRRFEHARPDVTVVTEPGSRLPSPGEPVYSTEMRLPLGAPRAALPAHPWFVPVLLGNKDDLVLYRVDGAPPPLAVTEAAPQVRLDHDFDGTALVGYDLTIERTAPPARVHLRTYWRPRPTARLVVASTWAGDLTLERHVMGFANLARYAREVGLPPDAIVVEDYRVVLPSFLEPGPHALGLGLAQVTDTGATRHRIDIGTITLE